MPAWAARSPSRSAAARAICSVAAQSCQRPLLVQEPGQRPGELPGVGVEAGLQRPARRRPSGPGLGLEPGQACSVSAKCSGTRPAERGQRERPPGGASSRPTRRARCAGSDRASGRWPRAARPRCPPTAPARRRRRGAGRGRRTGRARARPAGAPGSARPAAAGLGQGQPGQAGRGGGADVRAGVQPEQPEQPRGGRVELLVGPGQDGPDVRGGLPGVQRVQPAVGIAQLGGQSGEGEPGLAGGAGGGDAQRQGQPRAQPDQLVRGGGVGGDPLRARAGGSAVRAPRRRGAHPGSAATRPRRRPGW